MSVKGHTKSPKRIAVAQEFDSFYERMLCIVVFVCVCVTKPAGRRKNDHTAVVFLAEVPQQVNHIAILYLKYLSRYSNSPPTQKVTNFCWHKHVFLMQLIHRCNSEIRLVVAI